MSEEVVEATIKEPQSPTRRRHRTWGMEDAKRWLEKYKQRISIMKIAKEEGVDPGTISVWFHKLGVTIGSGHHFIKQPPLRLPDNLIGVLGKGPSHVLAMVKEGIWEVQYTELGTEQLQKYCRFLTEYNQGKGVKEIAANLEVHRSTVLKWRSGTDMPYIAKLANVLTTNRPREGCKLLPMSLGAGGNIVEHWIEVPVRIEQFDDLRRVVNQLTPVEDSYNRGIRFGLGREEIAALRLELFGYLLGVMLGDAAKEGGLSKRFASSNLDFQLTKKHESNERFGEFVCFCTNLLGIAMSRYKDKSPTGATLKGKDPSASFRWVSERSPLLAWISAVCIGLAWHERTSFDSVRMDWIHLAPLEFRKRFIQGLSDSDGSVDKYLVRIVSVPNSPFVARLLSSLGMKTARVISEKNQQLRTSVSTTEAAKLPIFNEWIRGYRYEALVAFGHCSC